MPSRNLSYYHWAQDKPCTTNQTYGFNIQSSTDESQSKKPRGPFDYTRPFSNSGFFPEISWKGRLTTSEKPRALNPSTGYHPASSVTRFNINKGYSMGHVPVTDKIIRSKHPSGLNLSRAVSAPATFREEPKGKDIYLWHTLSGCLVHAKNHTPDN